MTTIEIRELTGMGQSELLARWSDGEFTDRTDRARFVDDEQVQQMDAEELLEHFDGPYVFATAAADEPPDNEQTTLGEME